MLERIAERAKRTVAVVFALLVLILVVAPSILPLASVFSDQTFLGAPRGEVTWRWFRSANQPEWKHATGTSIVVALAAAMLSTGIGSLAAFHATFTLTARRWKVVRVLSIGILIVPPIWIAVGYFRLLGEQAAWGLVLPHALLAFPITFGYLWYGMSQLDPALGDAARTLGASSASTFYSVYLPSAGKYVWAAFLIAFLVSWDESVFSLLTTKPLAYTLPKLAFERMRLDRDLTIGAINVVSSLVLGLATAWSLSGVDDDRAH